MMRSELPRPSTDSEEWPWNVDPTPAPAPPDGFAWPRISVVMPSYNQAGYLEEAIRSVLLQGYPDLDFIVMDGGSTDQSRAVIERYAPWLSHWESEPDGGQSNALNKGFARADGELFAYLNSDDLYEPGALFAVARAYLDGHPWVVGGVGCWEGDGPLEPFPVLPGKSFTRWFMSCPVGQPGSFWSAQLHRAAGPFREDLDFIMDYEFWMRLRFEIGAKPRWIERPLARYRLHDTSKTVDRADDFTAEFRAVLGPFEARLSRPRRAWVWAARRQRRAREEGLRALLLWDGGERTKAIRVLLDAIASWPPVLLGPALVEGIRGFVGKTPAPSPIPRMWPE
jgi:glycosyltransferase involved in cell wall biosynthesis